MATITTGTESKGQPFAEHDKLGPLGSRAQVLSNES